MYTFKNYRKEKLVLDLIILKEPPTRAGSFTLGYRLEKRTYTRWWFFQNFQNKNHYVWILPAHIGLKIALVENLLQEIPGVLEIATLSF